MAMNSCPGSSDDAPNRVAGEAVGRIVVLGSLNVDLVVTVPHLPRPAETVLGGALHTYPGGKGANQAVAAARLGGTVAMVGRVGRDAHGDLLLAQLRSDGVDEGDVERDAADPTGAALILVEQGGQNMIAVAPGANGCADAAEVRRALSRLHRGDLLMLQLELPLPAVTAAIAGARRLGARVLLNAAPAMPLPDDVLQGLDVLVVNEIEAQALFLRPVVTPEDAITAGRAALEAGVHIAVVTLGAAGAVLCSTDGAVRIEPFAIDAVDATGAGDAFVGALAVGLVQGLPPVEAARLAGAAGAAAASQPGAQSSLPHLADLERLFGMRWPVAKTRQPAGR
jgi:ribokinase